MQHSLEAYFLTNLAVDTALMATVARANECTRLRRILLCGFLAASYAVLTRTVSERLTHPLIQLLLLAILAMLLCGDSDLRSWGVIALQMFGGTMMLGGIGSVLSENRALLPAALGAGLLLLGAMMSLHRRRLMTWEVTVLLSLRGRTINFRALIDTGNRLHEPISGLPVLIAEADLLHDFLQSLPVPFRSVAFGGLGGNGSVRCFHPDMILIRHGEQFVRAPDVWVALYPGQFPGASRALAPPSFAVIHGNA